MRLSAASLDLLEPTVSRPGYDPSSQAVGIVHLGIGAFHRAHQATYTDHAMNAGDRDWAILGVSLRSSTVRDQLVPQDGLFTVTTESAAGASTRLIGAVRDVVLAPANPEAVIDHISASTTSVVTLTVTEKGYSLAADAPGGTSAAPFGPAFNIYHYLVRALERRRAGGQGGLTLISCDNLAGNGRVLAARLMEALERRDRTLARWFEQECACPTSMVDRIVPATTPADIDQIAQQIGLRDEGAVVTEPFSQWVIEDRFAGPRPRWELGGAQFVAAVEAFETAKLRMLNGAHSALAYLGLKRGHQFVHEAINDPHIRPVIMRLMLEEAAPTVPIDVDTNAYAAMLLARFANAGLPHRLRQIAMDGSQKVPQRWLATLADRQGDGLQCVATLCALVAWMEHVRGDNGPVDDPMAGQLARLWRDEGSAGIADALFGERGIFAHDWQAGQHDIAFLTRGLQDHAK